MCRPSGALKDRTRHPTVSTVGYVVPSLRDSENSGIFPEMALRLGRFFRTTPDFWLNLQSEFDLRIVRSQKEATVKSQVRPIDDSAWVSGSS